MRKRPSHRLDTPTPHMNRRSFVTNSLLFYMAGFSTAAIGAMKALETTPLPEKEKVLRLQELCKVIQDQLDITTVQQRQPVCARARAQECQMELASMTKDASYRVIEALGGLFSRPTEQTHEISNNVSSAMRWTETYGTSTNCIIDTETIDCNDYGHRACEVWYKHAYQGYLLNTWPIDASERFDADWHQMGILRTGEDQYIIVDKQTLIVWNGKLESFIKEKQDREETPRSFIPMVGIVKYAHAKHEWPLVKLALTVTGGEGIDEDTIEIQPIAE